MIKSLLAVILVVHVGTAFAASGGSPNGKPFVEINGQIAEVQGQIATLEQRMDNLLARVVLNESRLDGIDAGIVLLQEERDELYLLLSELESGITTVEAIIIDLETENTNLQSELDEYGDTTGQLALEIEANAMSISTLTAFIDDGLSGLELLIFQNQSAINELREVQDSLVGQLEMKQNLLNGTCPEGLTFVGFEDGALVCDEETDSTAPLTIIRREVIREVAHQGGAYAYDFYRYLERKVAGVWKVGYIMQVSCPSGSSVVGGGPGQYPDYFIEVRSSQPVNAYTPNSYTREGIDVWFVQFAPINTRTNPNTTDWNPLWLPYVRGGGAGGYTYDDSTDPESTLMVSAVIQCAVASSPDL